MAIALITGGSSGFGLATSLAFAGAGHLGYAGVRSPTSAGALDQAARTMSEEEWEALMRTRAAAMRATSGPPTSG